MHYPLKESIGFWLWISDQSVGEETDLEAVMPTSVSEDWFIVLSYMQMPS